MKLNVVVTKVIQVEIDHPVFEELRDLWVSETGTQEQYDTAWALLEDATGRKMYDFLRDGRDHAEERIIMAEDAESLATIVEI